MCVVVVLLGLLFGECLLTFFFLFFSFFFVCVCVCVGCLVLFDICFHGLVSDGVAGCPVVLLVVRCSLWVVFVVLLVCCVVGVCCCVSLYGLLFGLVVVCG